MDTKQSQEHPLRWSRLKKNVAAVGTFDGPHLGHIAVFDRIRELKEELGLDSFIYTFENHPLSVLKPECAPKWTSDRSYQIYDVMNRYVDYVDVVKFDRELARKTAGDFLAMFHYNYMVDHLVMGYDNTLGSDGLVTREEYEEIAKVIGIKLHFVEPVYSADGLPISSSRIRKEIASGNVEKAVELLGRPPVYRGKIVEGRHLGRTLGFPTMNIVIDDDLIDLPDGVYAARFLLEGSNNLAVLSVGNNPTVSDSSKRTYELHVITRSYEDSDKFRNFYAREIQFSVSRRIRDIRKFDSIDELKAAIQADIDNVKTYRRP